MSASDKRGRAGHAPAGVAKAEDTQVEALADSVVGPNTAEEPIGEELEPPALAPAPHGEMEGFGPEPPPDLMDESIETGSRLVIIGGSDRGQEFVLGDGDTSLGRGLDNDVVLADIAVSRKHTLVCREGGQFVVRDLGSGNGTLVNGQRIETHILADGDQIELGNTLLRFISAGEIVGETGEVFVPETGELIDDDGGGFDLPPESVEDATPTADETPIAPPIRTERRRKGGRRRPLKLMIYGGAVLVVLLLVMLGIKLLLNSKGAPAPEDQRVARSAAASRHFDRGRRFLVTRDWEKARDEFIRVYALAPAFEHAKRYVKQAGAEMRARAAVEGAKEALSERAYDRARAKLAEVPSTSVYTTEVPELKRRADDKQLSELIASAGEHRSQGEVEAALKDVEHGLQIAPADQRFKELHAELTAQLDGARGKSKMASRNVPHKPRVARAAPRRTSAKAGGRRRSSRNSRRRSGSRGALVGKAMTLYERSEWEAAVTVLKSGGETLGGAARARASRLASDIKKVASYTKRAQASQTTSASKAMRYYQLAMEVDKRISGGHHKNFFRTRLYKVARMQAIGSASTGRYTAAYRALVVAKRHGTADAQLEKVSATLEKKAMELFTKGYTLRRTNPVQARQMWQRVLHMVPPDSAAYQKAYEWLNRSTPAYQDEDED